ncbi:hypothetical protein MNBD_PLANCTO02-202 [hydrothermal vent metagenome]|uniref:Uncharacterized protein n=1 Tax=hydrothermal vent metagenome TaxID=652676 RepID=A0A3B1DWD2_9ZZZZ
MLGELRNLFYTKRLRKAILDRIDEDLSVFL